ncbi:MAG TPA: hypothetical protein VIL86_04260 [Tepidisphaeraceae bacterium]|jgi:hypothetical protein
MTTTVAENAPLNLWTVPLRGLVFVLAATSIWCLLAEFYGLMSMHAFTLCISAPAMALLAGLTFLDYARGDGRLFRAVVIGAIAGLLAAFAYDIFRLPFVFSRQWGLGGMVPPMPLFKVFPRFGAMILSQPIEQPHYSPAAQLVGWTYHFSNGLTFGIMYLAMIGDARRRSWLWAVALAVGLELAMLFTPYPGMFGITVGKQFIIVTLTAHLIFGVALGLCVRRAFSNMRALT